MDLCTLKVGDPEDLVSDLGPRIQAHRSVEEACSLLSRALYEGCTSGASNERSLVLSRIYLSLPFSLLDPGSRTFAKEKFGIDPAPADLFLALLGTHGDAPEWADRTRSQGHRAIPLNRQTVTTVPMLARCFQQIGFDLDKVLQPKEAGIHIEGVSSGFGLFHVEEAAGSPFVPAQDGFVKPHGVRSVVGCGTMLPNGAVSIWIGFSRHSIAQQQAVPLVAMMPAFWLLAQPLYRRRALFAA